MTTSDLLRILLLLTALGMIALALNYLRQRHLAWPDFLAWALLAVLVPIFGPCLVIALRPGQTESGQAQPPQRTPARRSTRAARPAERSQPPEG